METGYYFLLSLHRAGSCETQIACVIFKKAQNPCARCCETAGAYLSVRSGELRPSSLTAMRSMNLFLINDNSLIY